LNFDDIPALAAIAGPRMTPLFLKYSIASGVVGKFAPRR